MHGIEEKGLCPFSFVFKKIVKICAKCTNIELVYKLQTL